VPDYTCDACGFEFELADAERAGLLIVEGVRKVSSILRDGEPTAMRVRPDPDTWSVHEYGCHLRDVLLVQRERVLLARREDTPYATPMGRDERIEHDGYDEQLTLDVGAHVAMGGGAHAARSPTSHTRHRSPVGLTRSPHT
jgi:hypothetical protein